ncbi:MAG: M23 family metallopeptidase [Deltaproteobacteria bacterium]|nr:M23 family metallopeptidase [Deltaproteobacteria bacterium]
MKKRFFTVFIVPQDPSHIRKFRLPFNLLKTILVICGISFMGFSYILFDYTNLKFKSHELNAMRKENAEQKIQLQAFASKMTDLEFQMAKLKQFDKKLRIITNMEIPAGSNQVLGIGGPSPEDDMATLGGAREGLIKQMHSDVDQLKTEVMAQEKSFTELQEYLFKQSSLFASMPAIRPAKGWLTSTFGYRISPFTGLRQMHEGLDIANAVGSPVFAPAAGIVSRVDRENGLGKLVFINHGYGIVTKYGHLSEVHVHVGKRVRRGDKIASIGNTGRSTGPHLHYEVVVNGVNVNPEKYILN